MPAALTLDAVAPRRLVDRRDESVDAEWGIRHAVPVEGGPRVAAMCGVAPDRRMAWSGMEGIAVSCPACQRVLAQGGLP